SESRQIAVPSSRAASSRCVRRGSDGRRPRTRSNFFHPGVFTFISERPRFRQITQKCIESSGGASEKRYCVLQVMFHHAPQFVDRDFQETLILSVLRRMPQRPTLVTASWQESGWTPTLPSAGGLKQGGARRLGL